MHIQDWTEAYKEIATLISTNIPEIKWVDMWHQQTEFIDEQYPFNFPAVFIEFQSDDVASIGNKAQDVNAEIGIYLAVWTYADSYQGSVNQGSALEFNTLLTKIHALLHGKKGNHFSTMDRQSIARVPGDPAVINYRQGFMSIIRDYSAQPDPQESVTDPGITVTELGEQQDNSEDMYSPELD